MNLLLLGYHGSGKTSVGRKLADALWREFVDVDTRLASEAGAELDEPRAGELQDRLLMDLARRDELIIAASARAMPGAAAMAEFRRGGKVVYLQAPAELLAQRLALQAAERPAVGAPPQPAALTEALRQRDPLYRAVADLVLETSPMDLDAIVRLIVRMGM